MDKNTSRRSRPIRGAALIAISVGGCLVASYIGHWLAVDRRAIVATADSPLRIDPEYLDLGKVWEQRDFPWTLPIKNVSRREIAIADFLSSCDCTSIQPQSLLIPPGETREVSLRIDLGRHSEAPIAFEREFGLHIGPSGSEKLPTWVLRGRVRSPIRLLAPATFGDHSEQAQPISAMMFPIQTALPLKRLTATTEDLRFAVGITEMGHDRYELRVSPLVRLPIGPFHCEIALRPEPASELSIPLFKLRVEGKIVGDVQSAPAILLLGVDRMGTQFRETITLASLTGAPFDIERWLATEPETNVSPIPGHNNSFDLIVPCKQMGPHTSEIRFVVRDRAGRQSICSVLAKYYGFTAEVLRK